MQLSFTCRICSCFGPNSRECRPPPRSISIGKLERRAPFVLGARAEQEEERGAPGAGLLSAAAAAPAPHWANANAQ